MTSPNLLLITCGPDDDSYLINDLWGSLNVELAARAPIDWAVSLEEAVQKLETYMPAGVLVLDAGYAAHRHHARLTAKLRQYAECGGTVIFCAVFPAVVSMEKFNSIFRSLGVPWRYAGFQTRLEARRTDVVRNWPEFADQVRWIPLKATLAQLAVRVEHQSESWYQPMGSPRVGLASGVAMRRVGEGYIAFVGERENNPATRLIIMAMLRLMAD